MLRGKAVLLTLCFALPVIAAGVYFSTASVHQRKDPLQVVESYLKATHARDYRAAYRYLSSADQAVMDEKSYLSQRVSFTGFALQWARSLAETMEVWLIERSEHSDHVHYRIGYRLPTADQLVPQPFGWDPQQLNTLSPAQQERLLEALRKLKTGGTAVMTEGQEFFDLVSQKGDWKIFFDWASATRVELKAYSTPPGELEAQFVTRELLVKKDEPFQVDFKIKNRGNRDVMARVIHHVEPEEMIGYVDMIVCGALVPFVLRAGDEREISSAYLLRDDARRSTPLAITYEFKLEPFSSR